MSSRAASRAAAAHTHADSDAGSASAACAATAQDGSGTEQWSYHNNPTIQNRLSTQKVRSCLSRVVGVC
jgi:hypothetical protein